MKSYIEIFESGGKPNHYMYLDNKEENKKPKSRDLMIISDIKDFISNLKLTINEQLILKKDLPKINENPSTFDRKSPKYHLTRFRKREIVDGLPINLWHSYLGFASGI